MSTTEFYTGTIENVTVSENSGSWSATHGYNTTYSTGWRRTFAVSNPDAFPGIKPEDEGVTWVIMGIYPTDSNMLDMTQKKSVIPDTYKHCVFDDNWDILDAWTGTMGISVAPEDNEGTEADVLLDNPDAWVWYNNEWVSLKNNNPNNTFAAVTNDDGTTQYFTFTTNHVTGNNKDYYRASVSATLAATEIAPEFLTTYQGHRFIMLMLFPVKIYEAVNRNFFTNAQTFIAEQIVSNDIGEKYYNVSQTSGIPTLEQDGTNWTRLPGFYSDYSPTASEGSDNPPLPYFRKPSTYRYITAFNTDDTSQYEDISQYYGRGIGNSPDALNIMKSGWQPVYQRKSPSRIAYNEHYMQNGGRWIVWDGNGWSLNGEEDEVASTSKRLLGLIIQAPGGNGGTVASSGDTMFFGGTGGGGGAYAELLINAYNNSIKIEFDTNEGQFLVSIKHSDNIFSFHIQAGRHGGSYLDGIGGNTGGGLSVSYNGTVGGVPLIIPQTQDVLGDFQTVPWYNLQTGVNSNNNFSWESSLCGILAAIPGGSGGNAGQNGSNVPTGGNYFVTGVPNNSLKWFTKSGDFGSGNDPLYYGDNDDAPGKHPGKASLLNAITSGGGGGASYFGKGGNASGPTTVVSGGGSGHMYGNPGELGGGGGGGAPEVFGQQAAGYAGGEGFVLIFR